LENTITKLVPSPHKLIADTGATDHFLTTDAAVINQKIATPGIRVMLPDGSTITSTHTATLDLPGLPPEACQAHIFPELASGSLISVGKLCNHDCKAIFEKNTLHIERHGNIVLTGSRHPTNDLWYFDPPQTQPQPVATINEANLPITHSANYVAQMARIQDRLAFLHAACFSPALSTWIAAIDAGYLSSFPELTSALVRKYPPRSAAMTKGHLDQSRKNQRSTKSKQTKTVNFTDDNVSPPGSFPNEDISPTPNINGAKTHLLYAACHTVTGKLYADPTGRFVTTSSAGYSYLLLMYEYDSNYIHAELMKNRTGPEILAAYKRGHNLFSSKGFKPRLQTLDNEASEALQQFFRDENVDYQLVPPHVHRQNSAERACRTYKNHFIAGLCTTPPDIPMHLWCRLVPQSLITLNLMRKSRINPNISAWEQLHGPFNYDRTPLAPPGIKVLIHEKPSVRETWAPHAVDGYYLAPAMQHYRCFRVYVTETRSERIADTLVWQPGEILIPKMSSLELAIATMKDLIHVIKHPTPGSNVAALKQIDAIFSDYTTQFPKPTPTAPPPSGPPNDGAPAPAPLAPLPRVPASANTPSTAPPAPSPRVPTKDAPPPSVPPNDAAPATEPLAPLPRVPTGANSPSTAPPAPSPRVPTSDTPPFTKKTYADFTENPGRRRRAEKRQKKLAHTKHATPAPDPISAHASARKKQAAAKRATNTATANARHSTTAASKRRQKQAHNKRAASKAAKDAEPTTEKAAKAPRARHPTNSRATRSQPTTKSFHLAATTIQEPPDPSPEPAPMPHGFAHSVVHPVTGVSQEYRHLINGEDRAIWLKGASNEVHRLAQGTGINMPKGTNTMHFIHHNEKPKDRRATYLRVVVAHKPHKSEPNRVRFTCGGDKSDYEGPVSTPTADLTVAKVLFNSVLSTPGGKFMSADVKDFYLNTDMERFEYMLIQVKYLPEDIMEHYDLWDKVHNGQVMVEIRKGMYGLPQAGLLANERLKIHLAKSEYTPVKHTAGLYKHATRPVTFSLVVDDFGVKYVGAEHAEHLMSTLRSLYTITTDWTGTLYCGLTLKWDYDVGTVDLSMPGYIAKALHNFKSPPPTRPQHSPHVWAKPNYGAKTQFTEDEDTSAPLDDAGRKHLQKAIGTLLYYARAIDNTLLVALGTLSSAQAKGTQATTQALTQVLNYCATHPDAVLRYHKSDMYLWAHSDASYLSEKKARSRAGGIFFLSDRPVDPNIAPGPDSVPPPFNGAVHVHCAIMQVVLSSATEAEFGGLFFNGKEAIPIRTMLEEMGHPQGPTPIQTDNACAAGIANDTVKQRRSKAMDMRFYWIRDRVKQNQFIIHWRRGIDNLADYFTKHHSPAHHRLMRSRYLLDLHRPTQRV
jgi:hypothetical protein